jgi:hypothetical protein
MHGTCFETTTDCLKNSVLFFSMLHSVLQSVVVMLGPVFHIMTFTKRTVATLKKNYKSYTSDRQLSALTWFALFLRMCSGIRRSVLRGELTGVSE